MKHFSRSGAALAALLLLAHCSNDDAAAPATGPTPEPSAEGGPPPSDGGGDVDGVTPPPPTSKKPNIIFILADDLSWNLVQYMPHVLQMQKDGVTFASYFVTDSLCCPSRTSILTGKFPHDSGVFTNNGDDGGYGTFKAKGNETQTFANALSAGGYRTALMGKYLNGYEPTMPVPAGWTEWAGAGKGYANFNYDLNQSGTIHSYAKAETDFLTDVIGGLGATFVASQPGKPFLLEMATFSPHSPYTPAPRDKDLFPGLTNPRTGAYGATPGPTAPTWLAAIPPLTPNIEDKMDKNFRERAQAVQSVDKMIGTLQAAVAAAGQTGNTYFVFSADNGYHMGEHSLRPGKQTAFDHDIHVPLIVTGPGVPAGKTLDQIVQNIDLCSTFAELGVVTAPPAQTGRSLVPLLHGQTVMNWRDVALVEHHGSNFDPDDPDLAEPDSGNPPTYAALRTKGSVYVEYVGGETEYYAHATDPFELDNTVAALTPAQTKALHDTLAAMKTCHDATTCWKAQHLLPGAP
jgi:N-acetylglucosamine-6-sulfatase